MPTTSPVAVSRVASIDGQDSATTGSDSNNPSPCVSTSTRTAVARCAIRPREGLPLGGLLPPEFFGVDAHLGFESTNEGAKHSVEDNKVELATDDWKLCLVFDRNGQLTAETEVIFNLKFEGRVCRVRCSLCEPVIGTLETIKLQDSNEMSGSFDVELSTCVDTETRKPLGWPPKPFVLHGSFDRLRVESHSE